MLVDLFFSFLQIGLFGIGGGLVSVSLLMQQVVTERQWLTATTFNDLIAIAESTPGPLVVNSATFIGMQLGGVPGAVIATFASVLPGFMIALGFALLYQRYRSLSLIQGVKDGLRPVIVALIFVGGIKVMKNALFAGAALALRSMDPLSAVLLAGCLFILWKWKPSPVAVILGTGIVGGILRLLIE
jgi:chromate transporter